MKRFSYRERDYAFGQAMLTLRTTIGLTQAGLADLLGVSRRAIGEWEAGSSYPKAHHLQHVMSLAVQQQAFAAGREEEAELRDVARVRELAERHLGEEALRPAVQLELGAVDVVDVAEPVSGEEVRPEREDGDRAHTS